MSREYRKRKNGKSDGEGFKVTYASGTTIEGTKVDDKWDGHARIKYSNGNVYEGEVDVDGKRHGKGNELCSDTRTRFSSFSFSSSF